MSAGRQSSQLPLVVPLGVVYRDASGRRLGLSLAFGAISYRSREQPLIEVTGGDAGY